MTNDVKADAVCCKPIEPVNGNNAKSDVDAVDFEPVILAFCCNY